jgi:hypothetical protein
MIAVIGWIGSALCVSSIIQKDQMRFRALNLAACVAMIAFNLASATWSMVLLNVIVAIINIRQIVALRTAANVAGTSKSNTSVVAVATPVAERNERELVAA